MTKEEKEFAFKKAQAYKNDALYWNDKANTHYQILSALITTISITALGYITLFFPKNVNFIGLEKVFFMIIIISSVISILAALWQNDIDQKYFIYLSNDSSKRQSIWENENTSEETKKGKIKDLENTIPWSKTTGLNVQIFCLVVIVISLLFLGISRLFLNNEQHCLYKAKEFQVCPNKIKLFDSCNKNYNLNYKD